MIKKLDEQKEADIQRIAAELYKISVIVDEITRLTDAHACEVWKRICLEMEQTGYNVCQEVVKYNVTHHVFDENMIRFYQESDGFIYETSVESRNPYRVQKWLNIVRFLLSNSSKPSEKKVLMYGDSVGSDSIFLKLLGFDVYYHDFESYCSAFAHKRFTERNLEIKKFNESSKIFDFVVCLEVAEHVPNPKQLIAELSGYLNPDGYCIFSEAFALLKDNFPTHLRSNLDYAGKTDQLFKAAGMYVSLKDADNKPIIYTKNVLKEIKKKPVPKSTVIRRIKNAAKALRAR